LPPLGIGSLADGRLVDRRDVFRNEAHADTGITVRVRMPWAP
jgi:hypothetical protein